jgi:hypothetical protein
VKIGCHCGEVIVDQTDDLPFKAHWVPDQEWYVNAEALDVEVIDPVADGRLGKQTAYRQARLVISRSARFMWQCAACGRLYLEGLDEQLRCFVREGDPLDREVFRSRPSQAEQGAAARRPREHGSADITSPPA